MNVQIKFDTSFVKEASNYPNRTKWAVKEALSMLGGHLRKQIQTHVETGGSGWAPLSPMTLRQRKKEGGPTSPLYNLGKFARFKVQGGQSMRMRVGFLSGYRFSRYIKGIAKRMESGKTMRVTPKVQRHLAGLGIPTRKSTKSLKVPARSMVGFIFRREQGNIGRYLQEKFWEKFYSAKGQGITR